VVVDIGATYGQETITSGEHVKIIVTPTDAYLRGSATGLTTIMGLTAAEQKKVGNALGRDEGRHDALRELPTNLTTAVLAGILPAAKGTKFKVGGGKNSKDYQLTWKTAATSTAAATKSVLTISSGSKVAPQRGHHRQPAVAAPRPSPSGTRRSSSTRRRRRHGPVRDGHKVTSTSLM
jgi:hypothetical protein